MALLTAEQRRMAVTGFGLLTERLREFPGESDQPMEIRVP